METAAEIADAVNRTLAAHGLPHRPEPEIRPLVGAGTRELMLRLLARLLLEEPQRAERLRVEQLLRGLHLHYPATGGTRSALYPGAIEALEALVRHFTLDMLYHARRQA